PFKESNAGFYSRYFLVPKRDGNYRPILDLRVLNKALMPLRIRMLTPRRLVQFIRPNDWFITNDLKDAYFHIPIHHRHRRVVVSSRCRKALAIWRTPWFLAASGTMGIVSRRVVVTTDASTKGW